MSGSDSRQDTVEGELHAEIDLELCGQHRKTRYIPGPGRMIGLWIARQLRSRWGLAPYAVSRCARQLPALLLHAASAALALLQVADGAAAPLQIRLPKALFDAAAASGNAVLLNTPGDASAGGRPCGWRAGGRAGKRCLRVVWLREVLGRLR